MSAEKATKNTAPEQPAQQYAPQPDPNAQYGPAPQDQQAPYQQQPVNQQYFAQAQAAPVQYVVMAESLKGVKGWLLFFVICFGIAGITYVSQFFMSMADLGRATNIVALVFSPFLAGLAIASVVTIAMQRAIGKWLAIIFMALGAVYGVITSVVTFVTDSGSSGGVPVMLAGIFTGLVVQGLLILYFFVSRRVKETLVN